MHASKGLEFDVVFLPGWEEGLFPHQKSMDEKGKAGLEEERRLAYVGITRAKKLSYISFAMNRFYQGDWIDCLASRFINELPNKNIEQVNILEDKIDDFESMKEVVFRRYKRQLNEKNPLPDLILIDGGKGQLSSAKLSLDKLKLDLPVVALAKRLEELFIPNQKESLIISKSSPALNLLKQIRDEAHRFAITFQRSKRTKRMLKG